MIVRLRAGDLHPAQGFDHLPQITADVELVEALGGESMAYFKVRAPDHGRVQRRGGSARELHFFDEASGAPLR